ncbi:uncharacterized protein LOC108415153 isoform X2 [Pygocentrus nattereri]|uniref:uncharacterized protein LOC108415153 isoform X2 n=1 Tax=Pygocentrus nattereri TaxID=42514 RepID=UPI0018913C12|nr:uncharacterized protein LOC108415153 isoform X2 [Pygocentrus nattereri]
MACAQQGAAEYLTNKWADLVTNLQNLPLIIDNLCQHKVFGVHQLDALKAEKTDFDKARFILGFVITQGDEASYELLRILDVTRKRTLHQDLHIWISYFPFGEEVETSYSVGTEPCQNYQRELKEKAKTILKRQWKQQNDYLNYKTEDFTYLYIPVVLDTDTEVNSAQNKIKMKNRKCKKLRHKKLRSYIPEQKQILAPEDLLNSHEKTVLLIGKPGIGKTSVIHKMLFLWSQKDNRELDYMFYFDEATLSQISNPMSLESLLFGLYCKPLEKDKKEVLQDIDENSENVIIVFDGISTLQNNQSLQKIMNQDLPEAKIVLTCRSELEDDSFLSIRSPRKVYVQGFSKESVCKYFEQVMGSDSEFLSLVLNNQELVSLCHVPMYAFMVAACMSFRNPTSPKCPLTVTEMFVQILRQDLKKAGNKKNSELDEYIKATRPRLTSLMESAFNATMQKAVNLSNIDRVDTEISKVLLKKITIKDTPTSVEQYHAFLHNTVQEFFSAMWLLGNPDEMVKVLQLCYTEKRKHLKHTIPFLCGLLFLLKQNPKLLKSFFFEDQIKRASDYALFRNFMNTLFQLQSDGELMDDDEDVDAVFVCQCLYESQSPDACLLFLEKVNYHLDLSGNELDPHQCCAVSYVISQSNERQVHLSLEDCSVSDAGIQMILRIAPHLRCESSTLSVLGCERPHFTTILDAGGRQMHLPVLGEGFMFRKAGKIIRESSEKISLHLHFEEDSQQLSEDLCCMIFQRLPQINSLRFRSPQSESDEWRKRVNSFLMDLCLQAALYQKEDLHPTVKRLMSCASAEEGEFLLDLFSRVKNYETQTGRNVLPALQPVYQSAPAVWIINLSERKSSLFLEVLKLQTVKKPVELTGWSDEESEVRSFLQCLSYISRLRFRSPQSESDEWRKRRNSFLMDLCLQAALYQKEVIYTTVKRLMLCVCAEEGEFLLDLFSHVKNYETQTGRNVLPALQPVYQSAPTVWIINLSERKSSLFLEVLKLQTVKTPVELTGWPDEESEVRSFLQCLPYISWLRFRSPQSESDEWRKRRNSFLMDLCLQAALYQKEVIHTTVKRLMSCASAEEGEFLLDLFSHVKNYETQTGRNVLPALQPVYQSAPAVWIINLSERNSSLFLEVLKLQTVKKPVELTGWPDEEIEVRSFLQCLPYISWLRISSKSYISNGIQMFLGLLIKAAESERQTGEKTLELLTSVCTYSSFPYGHTYSSFPYGSTQSSKQREFLLDLFSHVKNYETQTGRNVLPALQPVYQSAPAVWIINLSERKSSLFLEVLKLQTVKKPVELTGWSDEESEVRSFLQCLSYISQLRISSQSYISNGIQMFLCLLIKAAESERQTGEKTLELLTSVCTYSSFPYGHTYSSFPYGSTHSSKQSEFLLDLFSYVKNYETQTGRNVLPALQPVYQSAPAVWIINLSERQSSLFLEVLKLQTVKKPVELTGWSDEESEVRSFLQCLPYISQLRISSQSYISNGIQMFLCLLIKAAESERQTGEKTLELLTSVCTYSSFPYGDTHSSISYVYSHSSFPYGHTYSSFPYGSTQSSKQREFLLNLFSHVKNYETQTGRNVLPALQPVYQSAPAVWIINLSERQSSLFLEVLKLQTVKKPVELTGWSDEESEVRSFLQCLSYISQLRISFQSYISNGIQMFLCLLIKAAESERQTGEKTLELLTSVCTYTSFPYGSTHSSKQREFLLDLFSHVKNYETQTGRNVLPALQPVYQSAPAVWIINLSERKSSLFLEVLKLQTVKKPVELTGWPDEESEVRSFLQCLPYISQLRISSQSYISNGIQMFLCLLIKAAESERQTGEKTLELLTSVCTYSSFPYGDTHSSISYVYSHSSFPYGSTQSSKQSEFLLDLFSHVKNYETQTGRNVLPALQPVYQLAPAVWIINLSERKSSLFLEVLKLQTVKTPVELTGWSDEESEVRSFLQCLPYISQLRISSQWYISSDIQMFLRLLIKAAESERQTGEKTLELLTSLCTYSSFPYGSTHSSKQREFLLNLFSRVKYYETQTGRNVLPALQPVYQSAPAVWFINLSERKSSLFLEVLKLQTVKKPVELTGWPDEESEVRSFLQCLPYISQLRISFQSSISNDIQMFLHLLIKAAESERQTGEKTLELLTSVCTYSSFPYGDTHSSKQREFLLDLFSHVKNYETQTGRNVLPALQPVYHSAPAEWIINLSERKSSLFLEVLKLQTVKKPVELTGWSDEESEVRSFLQCLPYISQLRGAELCIRSLCKVMHSREEVEQVALLLQALNFTVSLGGKLSTSSCRFVGRVLGLSASTLNLTLNPQSISLRGSRLLFRHISHLQTLRLDGAMMVKVVRALRALRASTSVTVEELSLILSRRQRSEGELSRVLSSLSSLLRLWNVQCVNLTEHTMEVQPLTVLLCHKGSLTIRLSKETLQQLVLVVYETQEEEFTRCFLQKVGGDLTSCSLNWDVIHYFLQFHPVSVDFRKSNINQQNIRELVSVLDRIQLRCVDRLLLLKLLHCCSVSEGKTAAVLLSALQHRLDFSCSSTLDLTAPTNTLTLSTEDCRVISMTIQRAQTNTELLLQDCEMEEAGVEQLYTILHSVRLNCSKALLLQFLSLVHVGLDCVRRAMALHRALGEELDLSQTKLDLQACRSLALFLEHSEGLSELDLSHCQLTDHCLELLLPHLHKTHILDLSNNDITDWKARDILSLNSNVKTVRLFNNRITEKQLFMSDRRFEIWRS